MTLPGNTSDMANMRKCQRVNYALAATMLAGGMSFDEIAPKVGAKNGAVVKAGLSRKGVTKRQAMALPEERLTMEGSRSLTLSIAHRASDYLREQSEKTRVALAECAGKLAEKVGERQIPRSLEGQNLHADTFSKVVKASSQVFGWDEQKALACVIAGQLSGAFDQVIDVESSPLPIDADAPLEQISEPQTTIQTDETSREIASD